MLKSPAFSTSFLESRMILKLKSRKSRIKPGLFAFLLAERIIFGKKTQKSQVSLVRYLTFFVSVRKDLATRCARRPAYGACRGVSERQWRSVANRPRRQPRPSPSAPAKKPAKTLGFRRFPFFMCCMVLVFIWVRTPGFLTRFLSVSNRSHPLQHPERTRFRLFRTISGAFRCFCPLLTHKISGSVFVHCADMSHRLKPSVIPCKRDVSFLT